MSIMGTTWSNPTFVLGPKSYMNLLMRRRILLEGKPDASRGTTARWILRRLSFNIEEKRAQTRAIHRQLDGEDVDEVDAIVEELGGGELEPSKPSLPASTRLSLRLDPWSPYKLRLRQAVLRVRLGKKVSRSEAFRRILRKRQFTDRQRLAFKEEVLERMRREKPELYAALEVEEAAA